MKNRNKANFIKCLESIPIISVACQKSGIGRATYYRWIEKDKKFKEEVDKSLKEGIERINDIAESKLVTAVNESNMTAVIYWLKHHHKDYIENKIMLSLSEQEELKELIKGFNIKAVCDFTLEKFYRGEIDKNTAISLVSVINKVYPKSSEIDSKREVMETIRKLRESDEEFRELIKTTQQDLEVLPLMT